MPVWGTVLSDPLPIVGSVGRHPADYLMGRMPVTPRLSAIAPMGCPKGAARRITRRFHRLCASGRWVAYALRTRPPLSSSPKAGIPYDLHVLGLPLAFILSQDQTLRCTIAFLKLTSVSWAPLSKYLLRFLIRPPEHPLAGCPAVCLVLASSFQRSLSASLSPPPSLSCGLQKYNLFNY